MKCEACLPLVSELFDGELEPRLARDVRAHMSACAACSGFYQTLLDGQEIYDTFLEGVELGPAVWSGLHAKIQQEKTARTGGFFRSFFKNLNPLFALRIRPAVFAALLAFVAVGLGLATLRFAARPEDAPQLADAIDNPTRTESPNQATPGALPPISSDAQAGQPATAIEGRPVAQPQAPPRASQQDANTGAPPLMLARANTQRVARTSRLAGNSGAAARGTSEITPAAASSAPPAATVRPRTMTAEASLPSGVESGGRGGAVTNATAASSSALEKAAALNREMESARAAVLAKRPPTLRMEMARHFEKTRLLLLALKNTPASEGEAGINVSYEKMLSRKLADSNLLLRRDVATAGDRPAAELLDRVEPLLLEIANLPDRASPEEVASIGRRIEKREVIGLLQAQAFAL